MKCVNYHLRKLLILVVCLLLIMKSLFFLLIQDTLCAHQSSARGGELWLKVVSGPILEDGSGGGGITIIRGKGAVVLEGSINISEH